MGKVGFPCACGGLVALRWYVCRIGPSKKLWTSDENNDVWKHDMWERLQKEEAEPRSVTRSGNRGRAGTSRLARPVCSKCLNIALSCSLLSEGCCSKGLKQTLWHLCVSARRRSHYSYGRGNRGERWSARGFRGGR